MCKYPDYKLNNHLDWITGEGVTTDAIEWAESFGEHLTKNEKRSRPNGTEDMTTTQIRRFFGEVKRIEMDYEKNNQDIVMLKPMLAYAVGRKSDSKIKDFYEEMSCAIDEVSKAEGNVRKRYFRNFVKLYEAIVAYHKYHGGK